VIVVTFKCQLIKWAYVSAVKHPYITEGFLLIPKFCWYAEDEVIKLLVQNPHQFTAVIRCLLAWYHIF